MIVSFKESIVLTILSVDYLDVRRKVLHYHLHLLLDFPRDLDRIVSGLLLNNDLSSADTVGVGLLGLFLKGIVHPRYISKVDHSSIIGTDHDVKYFRRV